MAKVTGLEGVVAGETDIGLVDGEKGYLVYRGYWAKELAVSKSYEEVAYLLWNGHLPDAEELAQLKLEMAQQRAIPEYICRMLELIPATVPLMLVLQSTVAALGDAENSTWPPTLKQAVRLTSLLPAIIAYRYRTLQGLKPLESLPELGHAANYLYLLTGQLPEEAHVKALSAYLILCMEHGMNASTFAGRVVLSTESDISAAVAGAIGAMKGPLHGGAPFEVISMLEEIGTKDRAEPWLRGALDNGAKLMGFGHRIYKTKDPRAEALQIATLEMIGKDEAFDLALHVEATAIALLEEYKPGRRLFTNVEFYAAAILKALDLAPEIFTPTFTAGRIVGWTAHILEQSESNRIFRPQSTYTGPMPASETIS
ncbi:citrate synthase/methylcitrate synthase [Paenibacillus sp. MMS20-IR301]|uniref:citrate synthase/methylcitrate synthase n=1 Tax=Paenibacillus sp. MMS20-IR301 TaxID=2895946 RepID=UPI0028EB8E98|nr:citrate synthase/methylcitrate synthase [Paenibacillus sp. MMS20-IR301]WNS45632.1 citrate synthase/methylcitrate synthase [Paenibacillus sp. MMS20-IR301]